MLETSSLFRSPVLPAIFFLIGFVFALASWFIPERDPAFKSTNAVLGYLEGKDHSLAQAIPGFLAQENAVVLHGSALYPRYYQAGKGLSDLVWPAFQVREFSRLGFYLTGADGPAQIVLPMESPPGMIPNASEAIVFGCRRSNHVDAFLVLIHSRENKILYSGLPLPACTPR